MNRSYNAQFVRRSNGVRKLLLKSSSVPSIISALIKKHGISSRQAYRYLRSAEANRQELPIPERKIVFTVKLSVSLPRRLRQRVKSTGESLSGVVEQACEEFLKRPGHG